MPYLLFALALLAMTSGLMAGLGVVQKQTIALAPADDTDARAWLAYKASLLTYVENNPSTSGAVPLSSLLPGVYGARLAQAGNDVVRANGTATIEAWMPLTATETTTAIRLSDGDLSIGTAHGDRWSTPSLGDMGALPVSVPEGSAVSIVILSGAGYQ